MWGSRGCAAALLATGERQRADVVAELRAAGDPAADLVQAAPIDPPDHLVDDAAVLDVGGREVVLRFLGRGHTDHDLVVEVETPDDRSVVFAGDLVEQGAPPAFEDAHPAEWPATLGRLHALARGPVVPGHGEVVDADFVGAQREELLAVLSAVRAGRLDDGPYDPGDDADGGRASQVTRRTTESGSTRSRRAIGRHGQAGTNARTGSFSIAAVSASTPVSRSTVNGPRRPTLMSVAM